MYPWERFDLRKCPTCGSKWAEKHGANLKCGHQALRNEILLRISGELILGSLALVSSATAQEIEALGKTANDVADAIVREAARRDKEK